MIAVAGCNPSDACDGPCMGLDEKILSHIFEGIAVTKGNRSPDTVRGTGSSFWTVEVTEVLWQVDQQILSPEVTRRYTKLNNGDEIILMDESAIEEGHRYVFVTQEFAPGRIEPAEWFGYLTLDAATAEPLSAMAPPFEAFLQPGEESPEEKVAALVELVDQAYTAQQAEEVGEEFVAGDRLQTVLDWRLAQQPPPRDPVYEEIGAGSFEEYMAKSPDERQLSDSGVMPAEVMEALDLVPITILVIHSPDFATKDTAYLGATTPIGFVGPFQISTEYSFSEISGTRPRTGLLQLVAWSQESISDDMESIGSNYSDLSLPEAVSTGLANLKPDDGHLIVNLVEGTFEITDFPGMLDRQAELTPDTVYTGTTVR